MSTKSANAVRWTPSRVRKALPHPKPIGALTAFYAYQAGRTAGQPPDHFAIRALDWIANHADLIDAPLPNVEGSPVHNPRAWMLVPVPAWLIDYLATLDAERDDLEPDADREPDADQEPDHDGEDTPPVVTPASRRRYAASLATYRRL